MRHVLVTRLIALWLRQLPKRYEVEHQFKLAAACERLPMLKHWLTQVSHEL
jgi:hypothetical protein